MYEKSVTRSDPACFVILLDRSHSMSGSWRGTGSTLAEGAARAVNKILLDLAIKSTKEQGGSMRHYFDVGVFGYGVRPIASGEGVESALGGALEGKAIVPLPELANNPIAVRQDPSIDQVSVTAKIPIWVEPAHGYRTPMCEAIAVAGEHVFDWAAAHPNSFPPIILNITDGLVTDSPYKDMELSEWANRLTAIKTEDGPALLLNIFLSANPADGVLFPASGHGLPDPGPELFSISSPLPAPMIAHARASQMPVEPGARGLGFNADLAMLVQFLEIGTRVAEIQDR